MNAPSRTLETIRFPVSGMTCGACVVHITKALRRQPGVASVKVDLRAETVTLAREPALVSGAALADALSEVGYIADLGAAVILPTPDRSGLFGRFLRR